MKCPEELWSVNRRVEVVLGDLDFDRRLEWSGGWPKKINVKNWWTVAKDRESWKKILREAEAHKGLLMMMMNE
jgi:hypothetical protein